MTPDSYYMEGTGNKQVNLAEWAKKIQEQKVMTHAEDSIGDGNVDSEEHATSSTNAHYVQEITQQKHALIAKRTKKGKEEMKTPSSTQDKEKTRSNQRDKTQTNNKETKISSAPAATERILKLEKPTNKSALNTLSAIPPPDYPLTAQEEQILAELNPDIFKVVTPIKVKMLEHLTRDHPNRAYIEYVLIGLRQGFRYGYKGTRRTIIQQNLASIHQDVKAFGESIEKELKKGRYAGPFDPEHPPCSTYMVNPCGLVPKKDTDPTEYRVINHQSAPTGSSINDGIDKNDFATTYENVPCAAKWIREMGKGCLLIKLDIKEAYRVIPIHPVDQVLQGIMHEGKLYFDRCLAFGNRASAGIFCRLADLVTWIATQHGIKAIIHYIDDFLIITTAHTEAARNQLKLFQAILDAIGLPYKSEKTEGPTDCLVYLGIKLNTQEMSASIPPGKRHQIIQQLRPWVHRSFIRLKDLQAIIGSLMWVTQVAPHGRVYVQSLIERTRGRTRGSSIMRLNKQCIADIRWWLNLLPNWDGIKLMEEEEWRDGSIENLFTDASDWGGGATFGNYYTIFEWKTTMDLRKFNIQVREFYTLVVAVLTFRRFWIRKRYVIQTDNAANVLAMRRGACDNPLVMDLIRLLTAEQIKNNFSVRLTHIRTELNIIADLLSRGHERAVQAANPNSIFLQPVFPQEFEQLTRGH